MISISKIAAADIASLLQLSYNGPDDFCIEGVASIEKSLANTLAFATKPKQVTEDSQTRLIITTELISKKLQSSHALVSANPRLDFAKILKHISPIRPILSQTGIAVSSTVHPSAIIDPTAYVGESTRIGAGAVIGAGVSLGNECVIGANVVIEDRVVVGERCVIGSGSIVGSAGFGYERDPQGGWVHLPHLAQVIIGDGVEIGANVTIDRGLLENTVIESGVCLDNAIQVAHNVTIGQNTVIAAHTAIGGSTIIGKNCIIGGGVLISDHVELADQTVLTGGSSVAASIKDPGVYSSGMGVTENRVWRRNHHRMLNLHQHLKDLENGR